MSVAELELSPAELEVLEALEADDPTGSRRTDLAHAVDVDYPQAELQLKQWGLVEDAGEERVTTDEGRFKYRLIALTNRGKERLADARAPEPEPEPVEPEELAPVATPWNDDGDWWRLSEPVERILDETACAEYDEEDDVVRITLERDGTSTEVELSLAAWHNRGRVQFYDGYRAAFGEPPRIDEREWGVLQAQLVDEYADADTTEV